MCGLYNVTEVKMPLSPRDRGSCYLEGLGLPTALKGSKSQTVKRSRCDYIRGPELDIGQDLFPLRRRKSDLQLEHSVCTVMRVKREPQWLGEVAECLLSRGEDLNRNPQNLCEARPGRASVILAFLW